MRTSVVLAVLVAGLIVPGESLINKIMFEIRKHSTYPTQANDTDFTAAKNSYIYQPLDHNGSVIETFSQFYYANQQFVANANPPIFAMLNTEFDVTHRFVTGGFMHELARETGACMFLVSNRGYAVSDYSNQYREDQYPFVTVDQALADVANLITTWKTNNETYAESKVIVFGGSYAGNLATWARIAYPDIIHGSIASSAPLLGKANFHEYLEAVSDAIATEASPKVVDVIRQGVAQAVELLKTEDGAKTLTNIFGLCANIDISNPLDIQVFFSYIIYSFTDLVQYARPGEIALECMDLEDDTLGSPLQRLAAHVKIEVNPTYNCYSTNYSETVENYKAPIYSVKADIKTWLWQLCSEYGLFPYTDSENQPFGDVNPLSFYADHLCPDIFGGLSSDLLHANIDARNKKYGGLNPKVENVVFVHGSIDPWSKLGVVEDLSEDLPALFIPRASRSRDHLSTSSFDAPELTAARKVIRDTVLRWIAE